MPITRYASFSLVLSLLAGCAGAGVVSDPAEPDSPDTVELDVAEAEPAEPEPTLEDRWRAPFSVMSRGRPAPRPQRPVVVALPALSDTGSASELRDTSAASPAAFGAAADGAAAGVGDMAGGDEAGEFDPAVSAAGLRSHRVERGETWFGISRRYGVTSAALAAVNPGVDPERLRASEVILIPPADAPSAGQRTHTVSAGESLWGISRRYGISIETLREVNRLEDERIRIGQVLIIP